MTRPTRSIALQGASNFRDLGGYPGLGGRTVRWRRLFRSDHLARLSAQDQQALAGLGIARAVDLRGEAERNALAYALPGVQYHPPHHRAHGGATHPGGTAQRRKPVTPGRRRPDAGHLPRLRARQRPALCRAAADVGGARRPAGLPLHRRQGPHGLRRRTHPAGPGRAARGGDAGLPAHQRPLPPARQPGQPTHRPRSCRCCAACKRIFWTPHCTWWTPSTAASRPTWRDVLGLDAAARSALAQRYLQAE
jgi:hypothetical protein